MARVVRNKEPHHRLTIHSDGGGKSGEMCLIWSGKHAYLWACSFRPDGILTVSGRGTLRKLAYAILKEHK